MAFEITSDTVVKILVRRGLEVERLETLLSEGELGLSVDTRRVFVGDGYTLGGTPVGSINFGIIGDLVNITPYAQPGDMASCKNINYVFNNNSWNVVSPKPYIELFADTPYACQTLEYSPDPLNSLRLSDTGLGDGLLIDYSQGPSGEKNNTIQQTYGQLNFDARFLSLCAYRTIYDNNDGPRVGSFYFGNIFTKTITDHLSTTVNIEKNLSINDHSLSAFQLKMTARSGDYNGSLIDATSGSLYIRSPGQIFLGTKSNGCSGLSVENNNVTVFGNLSVLGDVAYLNSIVSVTSALSVVNSGTGPAFVVNQKGAQPVANFQDDGASALYIGDGGNVGIGTTSPGNKFHVASGNMRLDDNQYILWGGVTNGINGNNASNLLSFYTNAVERFRIDGSGNVGIGAPTPAEKLTVSGNISASGNVLFYSSTGRNLDLIHTPANDGTNPVLRIGESIPGDTALSGFSGAFVSYDESTNVFGISSLFLPEKGVPAIAIERFGNVGIGTTSPVTKLEVNGSMRVGRGNDMQFTSGLKWSGTGSTEANSYMSGIANSTEQIRIDTNGVKISDSKTLTLGAGTNVALDTITGSKIGTATTQKLSFYNSTPIVQPSSASQAAVVAAAVVTTTPTLGAYGYTLAQATSIITLVNEIRPLVNELRSALVTLGLIKGSA